MKKKNSILHMNKEKHSLFRRIIFIGTAFFLALSLRDLYQVAWGTGHLLSGFSLKWGLLLFFFSIFLLALLILLGIILWKTEKLKSIQQSIISYRKGLGYFSYLLILILFIPIWFFQHSIWGFIFTGFYFRFFIWLFLLILLSISLTKDEEKMISFSALFLSALLSATSLSLSSVFSNVVDYPFNLYWSDGNRLWDYSIMFGRELYNIPEDQYIPVLISPGRQFLWGIPFLLPKTTILFNRLWSACVLSFPYMILGWVAFKRKGSKAWEGLFLGFWAFLFLNQGPIYTPLVLSAILVALVWERSLWLAIPLVALAGYYAEITRWTWEFAPAIWAGMLSLNGSKLKGVRLALRDWGRAIALAIAGVSIWYLYPIIQNAWKSRTNIATGLSNAVAGTISSAQLSTSKQPLLWSRLFPSDTYPEGILGGLLIAILPLLIILFYLLKKKYWQPSLWQKLAIVGSLFPFLIVGLIISTKIGGGNNLHNLDMFLIALLFVAAIAWKNGGREWFSQPETHPLWIKAALILLIALPALPALRGIRPRLSLSQAEIEHVKILADTDSVETLPSTEEINDAIWLIRHAINDWQDEGEILFIDQRQLLTFGYVPKVPLVPEYEKKRMMNEAMSSSADYFAPYYEDLAAQRFSLIITEPLKVEIKDEEGVFAAENDLWTKWVAAPTLCYYEPLETLRGVYIQLLVPREEALDCSLYLP